MMMNISTSVQLLISPHADHCIIDASVCYFQNRSSVILLFCVKESNSFQGE